LIDFTLPGGTRVAADWCAANEVAILSGTTGLTGDDISALESAASKVPVLWAPNLSEGVALTTALVRQAASSLSVDAKVSISDIHHQHKKDAPSGTALSLSAAVKEARSKGLSTSSATEVDEPAFSSRREGEVIGEHTVSFELPDEVIEITHRALNRDVFARGALKAGKWLVTQAPGYYSTSDWLSLR
jgi:4-hydroxy-tetrahydrodipicolinate reductase